MISPVSAANPGNWVTDFTLYNLGSNSAGNKITITRYLQFANGTVDTTGTVVASPTIALDGSYYYNPADPANNFPSFSGSIMISAEEGLAGTVTMANGLTGTKYASDAYSAVSNPYTTMILPIIMSHAGGGGVWNTRMSIQNAGPSGNANVTVTYVGANAPSPQTISGLPINQMAVLDQSDLSVTNFNGSAIVTSTTNDLAVVVEEYKSTGGVEIAYNGIPQTDAAATLLMPGYIDEGAWATDFTVVNTTNTSTTATVTFSGSSASLSGPIGGNGSAYLNAHTGMPSGWSGTFPSGYYGSATVTAGNASDKLVVAYNIANSLGSANSNEGYVGFPATGSTSVVVPLIENMYSTGWVTTFTAQVVNGGSANLTLSYSGNLQPAAICQPSCPPVTINGSHTFNQANDGQVPTGFLGGVTITSTSPIVVIADQNNSTFSAYKYGDAAAGFSGINR